jgi:hypothetical protein
MTTEAPKFDKDDYSLWTWEELDQYPRKGTYPPRILALARGEKPDLTPEQALLLAIARLDEDE